MAIFGLTNQQLLIGGAAIVGGIFVLPALFGGGGAMGGRGTRIVMLNQRDRNRMRRPVGAQSPTIRAPLIDFGDSVLGGGRRPTGGSNGGGTGGNPAPNPGGGGGGEGGGGTNPGKKPEPGNSGGDKARDIASGGQMGGQRASRWAEQTRNAARARKRGAEKAISGGGYTVRAGDTAWGIAERKYGDGSRWRDIVAANRDKLPNPTQFNGNPDMIFQNIQPGQRLRLPN